MRDEVVPIWNMHGLDEEGVNVANRTNNPLERYNRRFNGLFPNSHPGLLKFVSVLKKEAEFQIRRVENVRARREDPPAYLEVQFPPIPDDYEDFLKRKSRRVA